MSGGSPPVTFRFEIPLNQEGVAVYRLFDDSGALLYVGCTRTTLRDRLAHHRRLQPWWSEVGACTAEFHRSLLRGRWAEYDAMVVEKPRYNRDVYPPPVPRPRPLPEDCCLMWDGDQPPCKRPQQCGWGDW